MSLEQKPGLLQKNYELTMQVFLSSHAYSEEEWYDYLSDMEQGLSYIEEEEYE